jgi:uncharacterized protein (UPF0333 family)
MNSPQNKEGQTALPVILLISAIVIEVTIAGAFVVYFASISGQGERLSARTTSAAQAGIRDAFVRITRDKNLANTSYDLAVGDDVVTIQISKNAGANIFTVTSTAVAGTRQRRLVGTLSVDSTTGKVELHSIEEKTIQ